jgi:single-strand DNA-binding protein
MSSINKVILIGRLGQDPYMNYTANGTAVCNFSLATSETWKDSNGEKQSRTEWHRCNAWRKLAEICGEYLEKGSLVYIEGTIVTNEWTDDSGNDRETKEIRVYTLKMLGSKQKDTQGAWTGGGKDTGKAASATVNDGIPF